MQELIFITACLTSWRVQGKHVDLKVGLTQKIHESADVIREPYSNHLTIHSEASCHEFFLEQVL
jgi:hypothetical protein